MSSRLILYPVVKSDVSEKTQIPYQALIDRLYDIGMIGQAVEHLAENRYLIGDHFLQYITFMGCAPAIELVPGEGKSSDFCHLEICQGNSKLKFIADEVLANPRCTECKTNVINWQEQMMNWEDGVLIRCPECDASLQPQKLNWRRAAGFVSQHIAIHGIYPKEALPTEALINKLQATFSLNWDYFYAR